MRPDIEMQCVGGVIEVYSDRVELVPKGLTGFIVKGHKGRKTIYFRSITGIQLKKAGPFFNGYLQFTIPGGNESRGGMMAAMNDENTFFFRQPQNEVAEDVKRHIENVMTRLDGSRRDAQPASSVADELSKLADLRDQGILSDDEFAAAKRRLLG